MWRWQISNGEIIRCHISESLDYVRSCVEDTGLAIYEAPRKQRKEASRSSVRDKLKTVRKEADCADTQPRQGQGKGKGVINMPLFTVEEINFMSYFDTSSRQSLIRDMKNTPLSDMDAEMSEMLCRMVKRLEKMSDEEFSALYIAPDTLMD